MGPRGKGTPACVYRVDAALVEQLDRDLGPPLDSYVRGWQVWLEADGPGGETLEWRLHPPAGFRLPRGVDPHDLFDVVLQGIAEAADPETDALAVGSERLALRQIWEVLEVFPGFTGDMDPAVLAEAAAAALSGRPPDVAGYADHDRLGDRWKGRRGDYSVGQALLAALPPYPGGPGRR